LQILVFRFETISKGEKTTTGGVTYVNRLKCIKETSLYVIPIFVLVLILNGRYKGQKLRMLVRMKIPAKTNSIIPNRPDITCVKYKTITSTAITNLIIMSMIPVFIKFDT
jgi:hypothetical protein